MDTKPALSPLMRLFLLAMILANLGGSMFYPFFAIYLSKLGLEIEAIGLFFTITSIFPLIFQIFGGWVSDRVGRLACIAMGSISGTLSWIGLVLAPFMARPIAWFLAAEAVGAISSALVAPSYDAFAAEQSGEEERGRVFGLVQSLFLVVGIAGPPLGGLVAQRLGYRALAWMAALLYWAATALRISMARAAAQGGGAEAARAESAGEAGADAARPKPGFAAGIKAIFGLIAAGGLFTWIFLIDGAQDIAGKLSSDLLPLYLKQVGSLEESRIGLLQGLSSLVMALCMVPLGAFADRRGERTPIVGGCVLWALSMLLLWLGRGTAAYALAFAVSGFAGAAMMPAMQSLTSKAVPASLRGIAYGFLGSSIGFFSFFAPAAGGYLWKACFPALPFLVSGALALATSLPAWRKLGQARSRKD